MARDALLTVIVPPSGIASRALMARLMIAWSNPAASTNHVDRLRIRSQVDGDAGICQRSQSRLKVTNRLSGIDQRRSAPHEACEREQRPRERPGAISGRDDLLEILTRRRARRSGDQPVGAGRRESCCRGS
jgi:hypothetical protein